MSEVKYPKHCSCATCAAKKNARPARKQQALFDQELIKQERQDKEERELKARRDAYRAELEKLKPAPVPPPPANQQRIFAKSIEVPKGHSCYPQACAPFEVLRNYGDFAVLSTTEAITADGAALHLIDGSVDALTLSGRLGKGALALGRTIPIAAGSAAGGATVAAGLLAGTVAMLIPNTSLSSDAAFYTREDFADLTAANTGVRINIKYLPEESVSAFGVYVGNNPLWRSVPLIAATEQGEKLVADLGDGIGLIWTPAAGTRDKPAIPALQGAPQLPGIFVFPEAEKAEQFYEHPVNEQDFRDAIIWFPTRPELPPIYLAVSLRDGPGVVTGIGEDVTGIWLAGAGEGLGVPIPTRIADQLRGRKYSSFGAFRGALWRLVSADPLQASQFTERDLTRMKKGKAKRALEHEAVGGRQSLELHHLEHIADGGAVYDLDNIHVNTPRNHINLHRKKLGGR